ncbi:MAG: MoxR family ATPase [Myxococcales bacterium]|nr:MoxR family ATPase [Myxococcales bacterium]
MTFDRFSGTQSYIVSDELKDAVNVAAVLGRPLLVKGEPGTGKTLLANAIAEGLAMEMFSWHVKSTSKAQEGLYTYDTVQRLNDSRFGDGDVSDIKRYIKLGPLGRAFAASEQVVLLIDEIDKADMEFPNDLLHELDRMSFHIYETDETISATIRPVVIITSNAEKELPDAFLRRCVFHYIAFPEAELLSRIVKVHHPSLSDDLLKLCLDKFYWLRDQPEIRKRPSTSELIDWIAALMRAGISEEQVRKTFPFLGVLLKKETDYAAVQKSVAGRGGFRIF